MELSKTIFCDIDGTLVKHASPYETALPSHKMELLSGTIDKLLDWNKKGYTIILTTGRRESHREITIKQLQEVGIFYDQLVMGVNRGHRILINDNKPDGQKAAFAVNVPRNKGLGEIEI
jgi:hydroxymethylpyrimidine pyrophosphatase-like HAD family hydrolase